ncbi:MAG: penicillin-binding protein [Clostridia bacterium]|nr:penicillin-binding protein [Clostridia bacterium]
MKNKVALMWIITAVCLVLTIVFWFLMNKNEVKYEEVTATVLSTSTKEIVNKNTKNRTTFYEVKVKYNGEEYELQNVHGLSGYYKGKSVTALLSNDKLYANVEGIKSTSPVAIVYFVFLFGTFGMIMLSATYMSKVKAKKQEA